MKYLWLLSLILILGLSLFNNFLVSPKAQLASLIKLEPISRPVIVKQDGREVLVAQIYSTYPFNHRNLLTINAGTEDGVAAGMPITADGNFLLGQVVEVSEKTSVARTIFDQDFSFSVRLGTNKTDALLAGGQTPKLTLLEKAAEIQEGDPVYSAGTGIPYGLKIGLVGAIKNLSAGSFKEAELQLPYQINNLREVAILIR